VIAAAREVVQTSEEARVMAVNKRPRKTHRPESPPKRKPLRIAKPKPALMP